MLTMMISILIMMDAHILISERRRGPAIRMMPKLVAAMPTMISMRITSPILPTRLPLLASVLLLVSVNRLSGVQRGESFRVIGTTSD